MTVNKRSLLGTIVKRSGKQTPEGIGRVPHVRLSVHGPKKMGAAQQLSLLFDQRTHPNDDQIPRMANAATAPGRWPRYRSVYCATAWFSIHSFAAVDFNHSPATWRVVMLSRFHTLVSAMESVRAASSRSLKWRAASSHTSSGTGSGRSAIRVAASSKASAARSTSVKY